MAETFNVSTKTIQRDLDKLSVLGIPIITHHGKNGGVEIDKNYIIAKQVLKQSDYQSLITSLYIGEHFSTKIKEAYLLDKFRLMEPHKCSEIISHLREHFIIDLTNHSFDTDSPRYKEIKNAMMTHTYLKLELIDTTLEVVPISYVLRPEGLCLYCYHEEYLLIPLTKVVNSISLDKSYTGKILSYQTQKDTLKTI